MKEVVYQIGKNKVIIHQKSSDEELQEKIKEGMKRFINNIERG